MACMHSDSSTECMHVQPKQFKFYKNVADNLLLLLSFNVNFYLCVKRKNLRNQCCNFVASTLSSIQVSYPRLNQLLDEGSDQQPSTTTFRVGSRSTTAHSQPPKGRWLLMSRRWLPVAPLFMGWWHWLAGGAKQWLRCCFSRASPTANCTEGKCTAQEETH